MNAIMFIYLANSKRVFERFKMEMKGKEQAMKARSLMAENPRLMYNIQDILKEV